MQHLTMTYRNLATKYLQNMLQPSKFRAHKDKIDLNYRYNFELPIKLDTFVTDPSKIVIRREFLTETLLRAQSFIQARNQEGVCRFWTPPPPSYIHMREKIARASRYLSFSTEISMAEPPEPKSWLRAASIRH